MKDAEDIFNNYAHDPDVTRYLMWRPHKNLDAAKEWLKSNIGSWDMDKSLAFSIWHRKTGQVIGMIGISIDGFTATFGYVLAKPYWNRGIMTEACRPLIKEILGRKEIWRVQAFHDIDNPASGKVMEKLGMKYEGTLEKYNIHPNISDIPRDCKMYSIVKDKK